MPNVSFFPMLFLQVLIVVTVIILNYAACAIRAQWMRSVCARHCLNREQWKMLNQKSQSLNQGAFLLGCFRNLCYWRVVVSASPRSSWDYCVLRETQGLKCQYCIAFLSSYCKANIQSEKPDIDWLLCPVSVRRTSF